MLSHFICCFTRDSYIYKMKKKSVEIAIPAFWEKFPVKTPSSPTPNWGSTKGCPIPLRRFKTCWYTPLFLHCTPNTFLQVPKDPTGKKTLKFQHKSDNTPTAHCLLSYIHTLFKNQSPPPPPKHPPLKWPEWTLNRRLVSWKFQSCKLWNRAEMNWVCTISP